MRSTLEIGKRLFAIAGLQEQGAWIGIQVRCHLAPTLLDIQDMRLGLWHIFATLFGFL